MGCDHMSGGRGLTFTFPGQRVLTFGPRGGFGEDLCNAAKLSLVRLITSRRLGSLEEVNSKCLWDGHRISGDIRGIYVWRAGAGWTKDERESRGEREEPVLRHKGAKVLCVHLESETKWAS